MTTISEVWVPRKALEGLVVDGPDHVWVDLVTNVRKRYDGCTVYNLSLMSLNVLFPHRTQEWRKGKAQEAARAFHGPGRRAARRKSRQKSYVRPFLRKIVAYLDRLNPQPRKRYACSTA